MGICGGPLEEVLAGANGAVGGGAEEDIERVKFTGAVFSFSKADPLTGSDLLLTVVG